MPIARLSIPGSECGRGDILSFTYLLVTKRLEAQVHDYHNKDRT